MTISRDLFLSILSMDAYNRGYNAGIEELGGPDTKIGNATIKRQSVTADGSPEVTASFYAISYDTQYGQVISYRGTDKQAVFGSAASASDIYNGWVQGTGL